MAMRLELGLAAVSILALASVNAQVPDPPSKTTHRIVRIERAIKVDGILDESEWRGVTPIELNWETNPGDNIAPPVKTEGYLAYDDRHLYVGFRAHDPNPAQIRANLTDRDAAFADDFLGVVLDTFNDERRAFEFFVNPLGVQMDLTNNDVGGNEDDSWDAIWSSAGKIHSDRYEVEMAIPFSQLRFRATGTNEQTWGLDLVRIYPRSSRHRIGSNRLDKNRNCYVCQFSKLTGFTGITPGKNIELDPTVTTHRTDARPEFPTTPMRGGEFETEPGLTAKWGVTPNLTLNAALNPDFSQVEADSVQLDINNTFALFFNEKRPFFLEGADLFETPFTAVYTRTIASPDWGVKLSGKQDKSGGGLFVARDSRTDLLLPGSQESSLASVNENNLAAVMRYRYDLGKNSTVGLLFTNRSGGEYANRVGGVDGFFRLNQRNTISAQVMTSQTEYPDAIVTGYEQPSGTFGDQAMVVRYRHSSRNWFWKAEFDHVGEDFRADSGFMPQVNYRRPAAGLQRSFWGTKDTWWSRIWLGGDWDRTEELSSGQVLEDEYEMWLQVQGPMQSFVSFDVGTRDRFFNRREFRNQKFFNFFTEFSPLKSLYAYLEANGGNHIDFVKTRPGQRLRVNPHVRYRATRNLEVRAGHTFERLNIDGGRLFTANVTEARAMYQFNLRTFLRVLMQYTDIKRNTVLYQDVPVNARSKRLFPQILFSYKINPQTVLFVGYSSTRLANDVSIDLLENDRTLFVKIGYAWTL
jgi:hypothetical protein